MNCWKRVKFSLAPQTRTERLMAATMVVILLFMIGASTYLSITIGHRLSENSQEIDKNTQSRLEVERHLLAKFDEVIGALVNQKTAPLAAEQKEHALELDAVKEQVDRVEKKAGQPKTQIIVKKLEIPAPLALIVKPTPAPPPPTPEPTPTRKPGFWEWVLPD